MRDLFVVRTGKEAHWPGGGASGGLGPNEPEPKALQVLEVETQHFGAVWGLWGGLAFKQGTNDLNV